MWAPLPRGLDVWEMHQHRTTCWCWGVTGREESEMHNPMMRRRPGVASSIGADRRKAMEIEGCDASDWSEANTRPLRLLQPPTSGLPFSPIFCAHHLKAVLVYLEILHRQLLRLTVTPWLRSFCAIDAHGKFVHGAECHFTPQYKDLLRDVTRTGVSTIRSSEGGELTSI